MAKWRAYERLVASLIAEEQNDPYLTVIPNARIRGSITLRKRQIDVLVERRHDADLSRRIIIDAKDRKRPVDVKEVEAFEGLMKDVQAQRGIIICSNGFTKAAQRRAEQHITIRLIKESEIENLDLSHWNHCVNVKCKKGMVLWDTSPGIFHSETVSIQSSGKCDECGMFHIWCWSCGNKICLNHETEWQCNCPEKQWFWLTAIEDEDDEGLKQCAYLLLVYSDGGHQIVDRRPL